MINKKKIRSYIARIPFAVKIYFLVISIINFPRFVIDYWRFKKKSKNERFPSLRLRDLYPCLTDRTIDTPIEPHYTYHPAWAARVVSKIKPEFHVDISSFIHFSTIVSAFVPVKFYDYRPVKLNLSGLQSKKGDLMSLPFGDSSLQSISCMHTIEHIGLGRYGDILDYDGDLKAIGELKRVVATGGSLIFVVPMSGKPRIEYNAHRLYSYDQVSSMFSDMELREFSLIPDNHKETGMIYNATKEMADLQNMGCGCFWFIKK